MMDAQPNWQQTTEGGIADWLDAIRRAFAEFLTVPTLIIIGFLLLAVGSYVLDRAEVAPLTPLRAFLRQHIFADAEATGELLGAIAGGIITVTSITISLLLLAVQQSASSMTSEVFDQFLRRRHNQIYFGFFVGLALYALVTLATVSEGFNPVFGASLAFLLTVIALYLLILLLYTTVNQMRPVEIIETIHNHILIARRHQASLLRTTRRASLHNGAVSLFVRAQKHGYVTRLDVKAIGAGIEKIERDAEVIMLVSIGSFVGFDDRFAEVKAGTPDAATKLGEVVRDAIHLERQRDIDIDAGYGIEQIATIGWTSISSSKSNPAPGLLAIRSLRDVLARWCAEEDETESASSVPVVYTANVFSGLMDAFETLAIVSSESMQHQNFTEVVRMFAVMFDRLTDEQSRRAEDVILRIISALGDHVLTAELDAALLALHAKLDDTGRTETAAALRSARDELNQSVGKLNSRSTRVPETA